MATESPRSQAFLLGTRLVRIARANAFLRRESTSAVISPLAAAAWSCLSSEKISDNKRFTETRQKKHFLQNVKDVGHGSLCQKAFKQFGVGIVVCNKGRDDGI